MTELGIVVVLTLLGIAFFRELVCWYFKFNEMLKELKLIRESLYAESD